MSAIHKVGVNLDACNALAYYFAWKYFLYIFITRHITNIE